MRFNHWNGYKQIEPMVWGLGCDFYKGDLDIYARIYNSRFGRRWNIKPKPNPSNENSGENTNSCEDDIDN